jgi:DNA-binding IscR family transcriptional regulator
LLSCLGHSRCFFLRASDSWRWPPANHIKIGHVIRTIDGPLAPIACASRTAYQACRDCKHVNNCTVRLMMTRVRDAMSDVLDRITLGDMVAMGGRGNFRRINREQNRGRGSDARKGNP